MESKDNHEEKEQKSKEQDNDVNIDEKKKGVKREKWDKIMRQVCVGDLFKFLGE